MKAFITINAISGLKGHMTWIKLQKIDSQKAKSSISNNSFSNDWHITEDKFCFRHYLSSSINK